MRFKFLTLTLNETDAKYRGSVKFHASANVFQLAVACVESFSVVCHIAINFRRVSEKNKLIVVNLMLSFLFNINICPQDSINYRISRGRGRVH
jgi:hypothetical protein